MMKTWVQFSHKSTIKGLAILVFDWAMIFVIIAASHAINNFFVYIISVWMIGFFQFAIGEVLLHEAAHNNLFANKKLNSLLGVFYTLPFFQVFSSYKDEHMQHHHYFGDPERDHILADYKSHGFFKEKRSIFWLWFIKPVIGYAGYFYFKNTICVLFKKHPIILSTFWGAVFALCYFFDGIGMLLFYWFVPLLWSFASILYWSDVSDHYNTVSGTRSGLGRLKNFLHHNNGYHALHHKFPAIPWLELARAYPVMREENPEIGVDVSHGFLETYRQLKAVHPVKKINSDVTE